MVDRLACATDYDDIADAIVGDAVYQFLDLFECRAGLSSRDDLASDQVLGHLHVT